MPSRPDRIVAVGDLNAAGGVLVDILRGTGLVDRRERWIGGRAELVQIGDVWNRGGGARRAFELLLRLRGEARRAGGRVTVLLGNHEAMTALRNEAYCTEAEYLAFATERERRAWPEKVQEAMLRLYRAHGPRGPVLPIGPRLEAWRALHAPGRAAMRKALGERAALGKAVRRLPIAHLAGGALFVHAGLTPVWARHGVDELNRMARAAWAARPSFFQRLPRAHLFRVPNGPLWDRSLATERGPLAARAAALSLALVGARRMVVGHTSTQHIPGGERGRIALRHGGRLVCIDVGLEDAPDSPRSVLVIEGDAGWEWTPRGARRLWTDDRPAGIAAEGSDPI